MNKPDQGSRRMLLRLPVRFEALGQLLADLTQASEQLPTDRRKGWIYALDAVYRFLDTLDPNGADRTKVPIATLMAALRDLDHGKGHPGLKPADRRRGGNSGYDQMVIRAVAAAAMDLLFRLGRPKAEAALIVARALDKLGVPVGNGRTATIEGAGRTVKKWRERLDEGRDQPMARERYESAKKIFCPSLLAYPADDIEARLPKLLSEVLMGRVQKPN